MNRYPTERVTLENVDVSLVIVTQDNSVEIKRLLRSISLLCKGVEFEVVIVDNGSSDSTSDIVELFSREKERLNMTYIKHESRKSLPSNRNVGWRSSRGKVIVFLDSDAEMIQSNFVELLWEDFNAHQVDMLSPVVLFPNGSVQSFGLRRFLRLPYVFVFNYDYAKHNELQIDMIHGCCFGVRRSVLDQIGGFDEYMSPYNFDEMDLAIRCSLAGFKLKAFSNIRVRHYGAGTTKAFEPADRALLFIRHALRSIRRNYSSLSPLVSLIFLSAALFAMSLDPSKYFGRFTIPRALVWYISNKTGNSLYLDSERR